MIDTMTLMLGVCLAVVVDLAFEVLAYACALLGICSTQRLCSFAIQTNILPTVDFLLQLFLHVLESSDFAVPTLQHNDLDNYLMKLRM